MPCRSPANLWTWPRGQCRVWLGSAPRCGWVSAVHRGVRLLVSPSLDLMTLGTAWNIRASKVGSQACYQHITIRNTSLWDWVLPLYMLMDRGFGFSRCNLVGTEWTGNKVLPSSTGSYPQCPVLNHSGRVRKRMGTHVSFYFSVYPLY